MNKPFISPLSSLWYTSSFDRKNTFKIPVPIVDVLNKEYLAFYQLATLKHHLDVARAMNLSEATIYNRVRKISIFCNVDSLFQLRKKGVSELNSHGKKLYSEIVNNSMKMVTWKDVLTTEAQLFIVFGENACNLDVSASKMDITYRYGLTLLLNFEKRLGVVVLDHTRGCTPTLSVRGQSVHNFMTASFK
jgi:hypothetical protein